jgi:hypothetical protein
MSDAEEARAPMIEIRATRRTGHAVVRVTRRGRIRRYRVSLRRYARLRDCTIAMARNWQTSGAWMRHGIEVYVWGRRA